MVIRIAGMVVEEDIMSFFPPGSDIIDGQRYGSAWTMKGRITVREPKGNRNYFIKHASTAEARESLAGEHVAMTAFRQLDPTIVGRSSKSDGARSRTELEVGRSSKSDGARSRTELEVGRSSKSDGAQDQEREKDQVHERECLGDNTFLYPDGRSFLVMDFLVTRGSRPRPEDLCYRIATIHRDSVSPIPNKFGFPTYTYHNNIPQLADWDSDWARFFAKMLKHACELETATHGPWLSRHPGFATLFEQTIPRLLGALQSEGRFIKPSLVHGNLSPRNMRENVATASPILFGFASLYAHNEYELGAWCCRELGWPYFKEYRRHFPPSEPTEQWNDRIRLYSIKFNLNQVLTVSDSAELRNQILRDINELNQLYGS